MSAPAPHPHADLISRLRTRAAIRRQIPGRKAQAEGKPDRLADLLEEAADALEGVSNSVTGHTL